MKSIIMEEPNATYINRSVSISVIIVARNEAKNISRAIESVLKAVKHWPQTEILLVDSASTDETVEIAKRYPINIVRLKQSWFLSASAGRLVGLHFTRSELVLHMDGDMELDPEWINRAVIYALENPQVGAIGGYYRDVYVQDGKIVEEVANRRALDHPLEVYCVNGAPLYRRAAIQQMGGHQPYIRGEQDVYLCMGLQHAGYKVVQLPYLMSRHYTIPPKSLAGTLRRARLNLWLGFGQVPRYYWGTPLFWTYIFKYSKIAVYIAMVFVTLVSLILTLFYKNFIFFGGWVLIIATAILFFAIKKRSLRGALLSCLINIFIMNGAIRGFFMTPRSASGYPTDAEIIQMCNQYGDQNIVISSSAQDLETYTGQEKPPFRPISANRTQIS